LDTAIILGVVMGSVVTLVLVFGKIVLGVVWTGNDRKVSGIIQNRNRNAAPQEYLHSIDDRKGTLLKQYDDNQKSVQVKANSDLHIEAKPRSRTVVQFKRSCNLNELIGKRVKTSEFIEIGNVIAIDNQSMTVLSCNKKHEYAIPDYYIRGYDEDNVLIDTSTQYIYHYEIKGKPSQISV